MFATMCHGTWNYLSEVEALQILLYGWRADNFWLHTVGGWSIGVWVIAHVWSLLLPSIFHGFKNVKVPGRFGWFPPQVRSGLIGHRPAHGAIVKKRTWYLCHGVCTDHCRFSLPFNPFRAPKSLSILNSSKVVPKKGFQL